MPARKNDPPVIKAWFAGLTPSQRQQYMPAVRRFIEERGSDDVATVSTHELVSFALGVDSESSRGKAVCALQHFFSKTTDMKLTTIDPAKSLTKAVARAVVEERLVEDFSTVGISKNAARDLSWRDVIALTLVDSVQHRDVRLNEPLRADLANELLVRLRQAADLKEAQALLDAPLLEFSIR